MWITREVGAGPARKVGKYKTGGREEVYYLPARTMRWHSSEPVQLSAVLELLKKTFWPDFDEQVRTKREKNQERYEEEAEEAGDSEA